MLKVSQPHLHPTLVRMNIENVSPDFPQLSLQNASIPSPPRLMWKKFSQRPTPRPFWNMSVKSQALHILISQKCEQVRGNGGRLGRQKKTKTH